MIASNYAAHARLLAESFLEQNPGARFSVLLVDGPAPRLLEDDGPFDLLSPADIGIEREEWLRRATAYSTQGLVSSLKPDLLAALLTEGDEAVVLIDADGCVYGDLAPVAELVGRRGLVLSPHFLEPHPLPAGEDGPEQIVMRAGVINGGFLAVGAGAEPFLAWWSQRTHRRCIFEEARGLTLSQGWLTLAMTLFPHEVLRDGGCNVAGWNLQNRDVRWDGERAMIDGGPLRHFHFAGSYDPEHPEQLTPIAKHARWWASLQERPGVERLSREYAARLLEHGYREARGQPARYEAMPGGTPIEPWMREVYRRALVTTEERGEAEPPNPFTHGEERFLEWVRERAIDELERDPRAHPSKPRQAHGAVESFETSQLAQALTQSRELLERIGELEAARDEAVHWAEGASERLREAERSLGDLQRAFAGQAATLENQQATLESVWRSWSWRWTRPLRTAKNLTRMGRR